MGFGNVDREEGDAILILVVELVEGGNLPPIGRSSVAAEDEDDGLRGVQLGELYDAGFVLFREGKVGRLVADFEITRAGVSPSGLEWEE
jgi:hypothetical protein